MQLAPVLAAEKSKTAFYIMGGVLVVWALVLSMGIGMRRPNFPDSLRVERGVIAISVTLVIATLAAAVLTSGGPSKSEAATAPSAATPPTNTVAPIAPKTEPEAPPPTSTAKAKTKTSTAKANARKKAKTKTSTAKTTTKASASKSSTSKASKSSSSKDSSKS